MSETREPVLRRALELACRRIEDGPQEYHEANTAEGWQEVYLLQAAAELECGACSGAGRRWDDTCASCGGEGVQRAKVIPCATCNGTGRCPDCRNVTGMMAEGFMCDTCCGVGECPDCYEERHAASAPSERQAEVTRLREALMEVRDELFATSRAPGHERLFRRIDEVLDCAALAEGAPEGGSSG